MKGSMRHLSALSIALCPLLVFMACGSKNSTTTTPPPPVVSVSVSPASANLIAGAQQQFSAVVQNSANPSVTWNLAGSGCSGAACGSISPSGVYTAPTPIPSATAVSVIATAGADPTKSGSATANLMPVSVSVSPPSANLIAGAQQQFNAVVQNSANPSFTWSIAGSGCSGTACGTIGPSGVYTAPTPIPSATAVSVIATAAADPTKSGSASANLIPVSVSVNPSTASIYQRDMTQLVPVINGTNNPSVTWSINGMIGGGCDTGYILPTGLYTTAMCDIFGTPRTFTITAISNVDNSKSGTAQVTVAGPSPNNFRLNGEYAFLFRGYDLDGPMAIAGRISADGAGGMTGGIMAFNRASSTFIGSASGNYSILADGRGTMFLDEYLFRFVINSSGEIRIIEFDETLNNPIRGTGVMKQQDTSAFSLNAFNGNYTMMLTGDLNGSPMAIVGTSDSDNQGMLHALIDAAMPTGNLGSLGMDGSLTAPDSGGFGAMSVSAIGLPMLTPLNLAYFVVSADVVYVVATDARASAVPLLSGTLVKQSNPPFNTASLNSPAILQLTGLASPQGSHVILAQGVFDGSGNLTGISDENFGGTPGTAVPFTGTYLLNSSGRGTANLSIAGSSTEFTFYMVSPGKALLVAGAPGTPIGEVLTGTLEAQTGSPFSLPVLSGTYATGSLPPSTGDVPEILATLTLTSNGNFTRTFDSCSFVGCNLGQQDSGSFTLIDPNVGRGVANMGGLAGQSVFYVVSRTKLLLLNSVMPNDSSASVEVLQQ